MQICGMAIVGGERAYMVPDDTKEDKPLSLLLCTLKNLHVPQLQAAGFSQRNKEAELCKVTGKYSPPLNKNTFEVIKIKSENSAD